MLTEKIKYKNFADEDVERVLYFNLTKTQVITLQSRFNGRLTTVMQTYIDAGNMGEMFKFLEELVVLTYGERSEDGEDFDNSPETQEKFRRSAAFQAFFDSLIDDQAKAAEWFIKVLPKDLQGAAREGINGLPDQPKGRPTLPPGAVEQQV